MQKGCHLINVWSRTQAIVALLTSETELYGAVKATCGTPGIISLFKDLGIDTSGVVMTDANATLGMIKKKGLGKRRHIQTCFVDPERT